MKKTSVYLYPEDVERLRELAGIEGRSQADIIRLALASYAATGKPDRNFALDSTWEGDGSSVADIPEEELLKGFGS